MSAAGGRRLRVGTRGSRLALAQTHAVLDRLRAAHPDLVVELHTLVTRPELLPEVPLERLGDKGLFVLDFEVALHEGSIDIAVHSLKDVPHPQAGSWLSAGLEIAAVPLRADVRDVLVSRDGAVLDRLPTGAVVGTSSRRRAAGVRRLRPDLELRPIRGNVDTRLRKLRSGDYDAVVLAAAGLDRLGLADVVTEFFPVELFVPAPGQAAIAVQCRAGSSEAALVATIEDPAVRGEVEAERAFAAALGADCYTPIGACARFAGGRLRLLGEVADPEGREFVRVELAGPADDPIGLGEAAASRALAEGAGPLLARAHAHARTHALAQGRAEPARLSGGSGVVPGSRSAEG